MSQLPIITNVTEDIKALVDALNQQKEEQRFQFLNDLDEKYEP